MIKALYSNEQFLKSVRDKNTTHLAYKFVNGAKNVKIISTKSNDHLISKIIYYATVFFGGYYQVDLSLQKGFFRPNFNILDLLNPGLEKRTIQFKKENVELSKEKTKITKEIEKLNPNLQAIKNELKQAKEKLDASSSQTLRYQETYNQLKKNEDQLTQSVENLRAEKNGLEENVRLEEQKLSALNQHHWAKIQELLMGSNPAQYLSFLEQRMSNLEKMLNEDFPRSFNDYYTSSYKDSSDYRLLKTDYIDKISRVRERLRSGVKNLEQQNSSLREISGINIHPKILSSQVPKRISVVENLKECIELSFRFHSVHHTNH